MKIERADSRLGFNIDADGSRIVEGHGAANADRGVTPRSQRPSGGLLASFAAGYGAAERQSDIA